MCMSVTSGDGCIVRRGYDRGTGTVATGPGSGSAELWDTITPSVYIAAHQFISIHLGPHRLIMNIPPVIGWHP